MIYQIYNLENNIIYEFKIEELLNFIKNNFKCTFYKIINNQHIKINNNIILNTIFIIHRINTINELLDIDKQFGVEIIILFYHMIHLMKIIVIYLKNILKIMIKIY